MSSADNASGDALSGLLDRQQIETLIHRYARSVDRIDPPLGHSVFHHNATADYGSFYQGTGRGAVDAICESHRHLLMHSHQITTVAIEIDGDAAGSEAYHFATVRQQAGDKIFQISIWGRYLDRWSRRDGTWGIDHRRVVMDMDEIREVTPFTPVSTARRDQDCPSYAVLRLRPAVA